MIINQAPQHQAVISNVESTGNFSMKSSPKAFQILSSSLYANKIKAIIRELSCNAVDSHVAAGKADVPFTVHLPNSIEPFFSIRDYGTGLSKDQVLNLYVTYFDSTKADSNDYIGAMGLGSKSPFSYTDNYSVTSIKDGIKGLYTAYIDDTGLPSIALMTECETDEPNGVEVKFAVNNSSDFYKFEREAIEVFTYFTVKPEIIGRNVTLQERTYEYENLVPGVHLTGNYSRAVMGNIAYPIDVPNSEEVLGEALKSILRCGVEMHFPIGALDFQASREGLSYIPMTVNAIKNKLEEVLAAITELVKTDVEKQSTLWEKKCTLTKLRDKPLFNSAAMKYHTDNNLNWFGSRWSDCEVSATSEFLAEKFNISVTAFTHTWGSNKPLKPRCEYISKVPGVVDRKDVYYFVVAERVMFVENDTKVGASERAKAHWRKSSCSFTDKNSVIYVLNASDRKKPVDFAGFYDYVGNPTKIIKASSLIEMKKKSSVSVGVNKKDSDDETIIKLGYGHTSKSRWNNVAQWGTHHALSSFDDSTTHYYLHFSGYEMISEYGTESVDWLFRTVYESGLIGQVPVYAVRKSDIEAVKAKPNWVNFEKFVIDTFNAKRDSIETTLAMEQLGDRWKYIFDSNDFSAVEDTDIGEIAVEYTRHRRSYSKYNLDRLVEKYMLDPISKKNKEDEWKLVFDKYPMLKYLERYSDIPKEVLVNYVKQCNNDLVEQ